MSVELYGATVLHVGTLVNTPLCKSICLFVSFLCHSYFLAFWGAFGAPIYIVFTLGIRMASCSYYCRKARQVIVMCCRPPFVYMYVCMYIIMYIHPSQPEIPRLCNSPVFSAGAHDNKMLYLTTIGHESAQHSTSSLHTAFKYLLTSLIASARATCLLAIPPYWPTSFAPRGWEHFHCSLG